MARSSSAIRTRALIATYSDRPGCGVGSHPGRSDLSVTGSRRRRSRGGVVARPVVVAVVVTAVVSAVSIVSAWACVILPAVTALSRWVLASVTMASITSWAVLPLLVAR